MTPAQAAERMRKIARHGDRERGIELLCEIAHKSGFYRASEIFERMKSDG
jgi:hypothetical protein